MSVTFGASTWLWTSPFTSDHGDLLRGIARLGFDLADAVRIWNRFSATQDEFASRGFAFLRALFDKPLRIPRVPTLTATA